MDFPIFHLDVFGNRLLIAAIASLHVVINHMLAVGAAPLIAFLEWRGYATGDERWDRLAYRLLFICFIVTTSLGALTGVGIWLSTSLVNPHAIGSLIRVFFWAWFSEWIVFVTEVALILIYTLSWRTDWARRHKRAHLGLGVALAVASWLTMAVIVAILGFQMDTGVWTVDPGFWTAVLNPLYLPQLFFRTPFALVAAGLFALAVTGRLTRGDPEFRGRAVRTISAWTLLFCVPWLAAAWGYWQAIPARMLDNVSTALTTLAFQQYLDPLRLLIGASLGAVVLACAWGVGAPRRLPSAVLVVPAVLAVWQLAYFERVREFIRKPDIVAAYMYSNALRPADYPLYAQDGLLAHATYASVRAVTGENRIQAGREVFRLACSRCHTTRGVNGIVAKLAGLYGPGAWDPAVLDTYLAGMHNARPFMPPLPGTATERAALADYLIALRHDPAGLDGAQTAGAAGSTR
ncbi:MAG TPA: c-type cytochrome [Candidatus Krumholzibacteria bacterium]|nr:c-type cytochrome [Candidatus Krumholzibacteria bacterium]HPD73178.1 c-type cytochrome [Candidatus Krumholzibacteria bacterium]HRY41944.1 c-type cytochrome [Candidatus Krumholzibacteria bacterium]